MCICCLWPSSSDIECQPESTINVLFLLLTGQVQSLCQCFHDLKERRVLPLYFTCCYVSLLQSAPVLFSPYVLCGMLGPRIGEPCAAAAYPLDILSVFEIAGGEEPMNVTELGVPPEGARPLFLTACSIRLRPSASPLATS